VRSPGPIAFQLGSLTVRWYGLLIAAALVIGLCIAVSRADKAGIRRDDVYDFFILMVPSIIVGARLWYVLFEWSYYRFNPREIFMIWHGGLAIHGGIIAAIIAGALFCRARRLSFLKLADVMIPALPLGQAIGRWGNFFNGEAYGRQTTLPWAITVKDPNLGWIHVHPTFLYESLWDLGVFLILLLVIEKKFKKTDGELLFSYFILYSIGRFFIEGLRTDSLMFFGLRTAQLVSLALIAVGIIGLIWLHKSRATASED
jgi:phosphatidylglycerol:prolipoprotein diacylglycerol transferase